MFTWMFPKYTDPVSSHSPRARLAPESFRFKSLFRFLPFWPPRATLAAAILSSLACLASSLPVLALLGGPAAHRGPLATTQRGSAHPLPPCAASPAWSRAHSRLLNSGHCLDHRLLNSGHCLDHRDGPRGAAPVVAQHWLLVARGDCARCSCPAVKVGSASRRAVEAAASAGQPLEQREHQRGERRVQQLVQGYRFR